MNIYKKLIEVRKTCAYLKKDNQGHQFKYVSSSQALGTLRGAMDEHALLLVPSVISQEVREQTTKNGGRENYTILEMEFTWVNADNPEERVVCKWTGQGLDSGEKGVGKALTYAEKYFLLKFFNIATDKDDPDAHQPSSNPPPGKPWYDGFEKESGFMLRDIKAGTTTGQGIIDYLERSFQVNQATKDKILALDKQAS